MSPRTAQVVFIVFNILAIFAVAYVLKNYIEVNNAISGKVPVIPFDTGTYYLLLMSVFWWMSVLQFVGSRNGKSSLLKYGNQILVVWFVLMLMLANMIPFSITNKMETAGYVKCEDSREISRVSKGESSYFTLGGCN